MTPRQSLGLYGFRLTDAMAVSRADPSVVHGGWGNVGR